MADGVDGYRIEVGWGKLLERRQAHAKCNGFWLSHFRLRYGSVRHACCSAFEGRPLAVRRAGPVGTRSLQ